mmetsp:Transcript_34682/g.95581  ORF Transcript_34682/g.95581 Transcript_34682/m.95581 type:complete len:222 (+) Transcript_34682:791-1456(+)
MLRGLLRRRLRSRLRGRLQRREHLCRAIPRGPWLGELGHMAAQHSRATLARLEEALKDGRGCGLRVRNVHFRSVLDKPLVQLDRHLQCFPDFFPQLLQLRGRAGCQLSSLVDARKRLLGFHHLLRAHRHGVQTVLSEVPQFELGGLNLLRYGGQLAKLLVQLHLGVASTEPLLMFHLLVHHGERQTGLIEARRREAHGHHTRRSSSRRPSAVRGHGAPGRR